MLKILSGCSSIVGPFPPLVLMNGGDMRENLKWVKKNSAYTRPNLWEHL